MAAQDGLVEGRQFGVGLVVHVLGVEPPGLVGLESGARFRDAVEREAVDQLLHREDLLLRAGVPAQQRQHVDERLGEIAVLAVAVGGLTRRRGPEERKYRESHLVAVALRELAAARGFEQQGQVGEPGLHVRPPEGFVQEVVQRQRRQPLFAADDVRHLHQPVVDDVCQVVGGQRVGRFVEHLVVQRRGVDLHVSADQVVHRDRFVFGHPEADHPLVAAVEARLHLLGGQRQRRGQLFAHRIIIGERLAARLGLPAQGVQFLGRVEGVVGPARLDELQGVFEVDFAPLALAVGGVRPSDAHAFVDLDAAPFERFQNVILRSGDEPLRIGVLDAQDHRSLVPAGEQVVVQCRTDAADVQRPGGAGREAHPNWSFHSCIL